MRSPRSRMPTGRREPQGEQSRPPQCVARIITTAGRGGEMREEPTRLRADSACDERILAAVRADLVGLRVTCEAPRRLERLLMLGNGKKLPRSANFAKIAGVAVVDGRDRPRKSPIV